ncbi:MAG: peptidase M23, partial [Nitrosomonas sp.]
MSVTGHTIRINLINLEVHTFNLIHIKHYRSILAIWALILFCPSSAFSSNQENLKLLRERIQSLQKDLTHKEALKQSAADALQGTERAINAITQKMTKLIEYDRQAIEEYKQL